MTGKRIKQEWRLAKEGDSLRAFARLCAETRYVTDGGLELGLGCLDWLRRKGCRI